MIDELPQGDGWSVVDPVREREERREQLDRARKVLATNDPEALVEFAETHDETVERGQRTGIYGVVSDMTQVMRRLPDGRYQLAPTFIYDADTVEKIRQGYRCPHCQQDFIRDGLPEAFPERCTTCGYEVRARQVSDLERDLYGETRVGDDETPAQRQARWDWERSERRWRRIGGPGILVPRSLDP